MKRLVLPFALIILLSLTACENDQSVGYKFTGLKAVNLNSTPGKPVVDDADSIRKEIYGIRLYLYPVETYRKGRYFDESESGVSAEDPVADIDITSSAAFDAAHPPGTDLTNYFFYFPGNYFHCTDLNDGSQFRPTAKYNDDYADHNFPDHADLLLKSMPDNSAYRKFYIKLKYKSGYYRTDSTKLVRLY
jgi:hypothetical protein